MGEFKEVPQTFKVNKMIEFWANLVQNLDEDCHDSDLFLPAAINISRDRVYENQPYPSTEEVLQKQIDSEWELKAVMFIASRKF